MKSMAFSVFNGLNLGIAIQVANLVIKSLSHSKPIRDFAHLYNLDNSVIESSNQIIKLIEMNESSNIFNIDVDIKSSYIKNIENTLSSKIKSEINFSESEASRILSEIGITPIN
jgi:hypothetical protein